MTNVSKRTFSLTKQQSDYLDSEVASGGYVSSSELIREGIRLLQERDTRFKNWLVEEVGPAYDEWVANPDDVISLDQAFDELEAEMGDDVKKAL